MSSIAMNDPWMLSRRRFLGCAAAGIGGGMLAAGLPTTLAAEKPHSIGAEPQLFLDDFLIAEQRGFTRKLHQPEKQGLIRNADGSDWDVGSVYQGNIVCRDASGRFHMTYRYSWWDASVRDLHPSIGEDKAHWFRESVGYATSDDGIHWEKPRLGLVDGPAGFRKSAEFPFQEPTGMSRDNNLGCPFDFAYDLHAHGNGTDPARRFLLRAIKLDDTHPFAKAIETEMYYAKDWPDIAGNPRWKEGLEPIPKATISPRGFKSMAGFDRDAGEWFAVSQDTLPNWLARGGRDIARYASKDLIEWHGPELALPVPPDESRDPKAYVEYMDMLAYRIGGANSGAWLGQLVIFHGDRTNPQYMMPRREGIWRKGTTEVRLVISRDAGRSWQHLGNRAIWLPCHSDPHGYDRLVFATYPVRVGDEAWFYYCAWNGDHLVFNRDGSLFEPGFLRTHRVARATMRWNGYISLDAGKSPAQLTTKPLQFQGKELFVNLHAPTGNFVAELQDESGKPLPGFRFADGVPMSGDGLELPVHWANRDLSSIQGKTVRVKFEVANGSLYGFQFGTRG
ncbi:MAG: hypothetical protein AB7O26_13760 [Planctomycetaceae bacterium]